MPWSNQGGGPWGSPPKGPWGSGPQPSGGSQPPDLEDLLRRSQDKLKTVLPGGSFGGSLTITALTDSLGHAKASAFSLNAVSGPFNVSANLTTGPLAQDANFGVISLPGPPASITLVQGSAQSTQVTTDFATPLQVVVKDAQGNVVPNLDVTFTAPSSGASGTFANATATTTVKTDASGSNWGDKSRRPQHPCRTGGCCLAAAAHAARGPSAAHKRQSAG